MCPAEGEVSPAHSGVSIVEGGVYTSECSVRPAGAGVAPSE